MNWMNVNMSSIRYKNKISDVEDAEIDLLNNSLNISNTVFIQPNTQISQITLSNARINENIIYGCADSKTLIIRIILNIR